MKIKWRPLGLRDYLRPRLRDRGDSYDECSECGAVVVNTKTHLNWHIAISDVAARAHRADMWTRPIGGTQ